MHDRCAALHRGQGKDVRELQKRAAADGLGLQDGWARLEFAPEIHHGDRTLAADGYGRRWQPQESQEIDVLPQHFSLKLHVGEMAVITAAPEKPHSYGHKAFVRKDATGSPPATARGAALEHVADGSRLLHAGDGDRRPIEAHRLFFQIARPAAAEWEWLLLPGPASGGGRSDHFLEAALERLATCRRPPVGKLAFELVERVLFLSHPVLQTVDVPGFAWFARRVPTLFKKLASSLILPKSVCSRSMTG